MLRFIGRRLLLMIPTLLGITLLVQFVIMITPGDPVRLMLGTQYSEEEIAKAREELGLDKPFVVRYGTYIGNILLRGDFGKSYRTHTSALSEILLRFPYTLALVTSAMILALCIGIPLGIYAATHQRTWKDNAAIFASLFCVSMPSFWFALMLVQLFAVKLNILPASGVDDWRGWLLPAVTLALAYAATIARQMRSNLLEVIRQDYITTARAKGQSERKVLYIHGLKNAIIPVIMVGGSIFGHALGGSMISEQVFSMPGLGNYTLAALSARDYPVIQTSVLFLSALFAVVLLLIDLAFAIVDPRIRAQYSRRKGKVTKVKKEAVQ